MLRDALMLTVTVLPPGTGYLTLHALSCLLRQTLVSRLHSMASQKLVSVSDECVTCRKSSSSLPGRTCQRAEGCADVDADCAATWL